MYRIQSSSKRHLTNLAYLGVKLKKTLAIKLQKSTCRNIQTEDKKVFHSSKLNIQFFFCYIDVLHTISSAPGMAKHFVNCPWTFVFVPTRKSSAATFTARKELEWR